MRNRRIAAALTLALAMWSQGPARAAGVIAAPGLAPVVAPDGFGLVPAPNADAAPVMASAFTLPIPEITTSAAPDAAAGSGGAPNMLDTGRAQILLRSLTIPGWGQATLGAKRSANTFFLVDLGIWVSFAAFRVQEGLRSSSYETTADLLAGINLEGRDEEFRRTVGAYISSDEYNQLVVYRDAANLYYDDPTAYFAYIEQHQLSGANTWKWQDEASLARYQNQRQDAQRAAQRANTCLALAVLNRLVSAVHAARLAGKMHHAPAATTTGTTWDFEMVPVGSDDPTAYRAGVRARF
jgi:hypothetical protein